MKKAFCTILFMIVAAMALGTVTTYQETPGAIQSSQFSMTANGGEVFVEKSRTVHYARFACSEAVDVTIKVSQAVTSCKVSPDRYNITPSINGNSVSFRLPGVGKHLFIEINDLEHLMLFADLPLFY